MFFPSPLVFAHLAMLKDCLDYFGSKKKIKYYSSNENELNKWLKPTPFSYGENIALGFLFISGKRTASKDLYIH